MKKSKGLVFFSSLIILVVLPILLFFLINILKNKVNMMVYKRKMYKLLYIAEAGVERKIADLLINYTNTAGVAETYLGEGSFEVDTYLLKDNKIKIISTAYLPVLRAKKDIRIKDSTVSGKIKAEGNIYIEGEVTIQESSTGKKDASIFSCSKDDRAIFIEGELFCNSPGIFIKSRNRGKTEDFHSPKVWDDTYEIFDENKIENKGYVTVVENDKGRDTLPMYLPSVNITDLLYSKKDFEHFNKKVYTDLEPLVIDGGVYVFNNGVEFRGNSSLVVEKDGVILINGGTGGSAIYMDGNFGDENNHISLNIVLVSGNWNNVLKVRGKLYIKGVIISKSDIKLNKNIHLKGYIESYAGNIFLDKSNIRYLEPEYPFEYTLKGGGIEIVSWKEK